MKRYDFERLSESDCHCGMAECDTGQFVDYDEAAGEITKLREQLAAAEKRRDEWKAEAIARSEDYVLVLKTWQCRTEAVEAKLMAASEQKPIAFMVLEGSATKGILTYTRPTNEECSEYELTVRKLYAAPIPPADVQKCYACKEREQLGQPATGIYQIEQDKRIAELERKLAEQQAELMRHARSGCCELTIHVEGGELNTLLAKVREEGFADGSVNAGFAHALDCNKAFNSGYANGVKDGREEGRKEAMLSAAELAKSWGDARQDEAGGHALRNFAGLLRTRAAAPTPGEKE